MDSSKNLQADGGKAFPARLRKLMNDGHVSQQKLADHLGLKNRQSVAGYCSGRSAPDLDSIVKIASLFKVSTDYLLGATDDPSPRPSAVDELGLSPKAVAYLRRQRRYTDLPPNKARLQLISYLLEHHRFDSILSSCVKYVNLMCTPTDSDFMGSTDYIACLKVVKDHGFVISKPTIQANTIFSEYITPQLRSLLNKMVEDTKQPHTDISQTYKTEWPFEENL